MKNAQDKPAAAYKVGLAVRYKTEVLDKDGRTVRSRPWKNNLILDVGLDMPAAYAMAACFRYLALGTGTAPTKRDSGTITAARSGNTITANASFFTAGDIGRTIKFDSGQTFKITGYTSGTVVSTTESGTVVASEFTIWHTSDTNLETEVYRDLTVDTSTGNNKSSFLAGVWTHQRVFLTGAFGTAYTVKEIGWSPIATPGGNLFGRDLIAGGGDAVGIGQQYKVTVQLAVTYSPIASGGVAQSNVGSGWDTTGTFGIEGLTPCCVSSDGNTDSPSGSSAFLEFCGTPWAFYLTDQNAAIRAASDTPPQHSTKNGTQEGVAYWQTYTSGAKQRDIRQYWAVGDGNGTAYSFELCGGYFYHNVFARALLATPQVKDSDHTLLITARWGWDRVLVN